MCTCVCVHMCVSPCPLALLVLALSPLLCTYETSALSLNACVQPFIICVYDNLIRNSYWDYRVKSVVKEAGCSIRSVTFRSQHSHDGLQLSVRPVAGDPEPSPGLHGHQA